MCLSYNGKRKRASDKLKKELLKENKVNLENNILAIDIGIEYGENGMARLVANGFCRQYGKPVIAYYRAKDDKYKGSMAGNTGDFKDRLNKTDLFDFVSGHQDASGFEIKQSKIQNFDKELNEYFKNETFEKIYTVDFIIPQEEIGYEIINDIYGLHEYFGQKFEEPLLFIQNVTVPVQYVELIGLNKNTIKIKDKEKDITYIMFNKNEDAYNKLIEWKGEVSLNIIGKCSINEYNGGRYAQIIVEDYEEIEDLKQSIEEEKEDSEQFKSIATETEEDDWNW